MNYDGLSCASGEKDLGTPETESEIKKIKFKNQFHPPPSFPRFAITCGATESARDSQIPVDRTWPKTSTDQFYNDYKGEDIRMACHHS